jgi:FkbM family methyltransferase
MDLLNLPYIVKSNNDLRNSDHVKFIGRCLSLVDISHSQNFQDVWVIHETMKMGGFFVEFGATDGISGSNSFILSRDYKWKGILSEPNPVWHDRLMENRKDDNTAISFDCIYTSTDQIVDFLAAQEPDLSTIQGFEKADEHSAKRKDSTTISVKTITLLDLLKRYDAPINVDYISVDTEGSEYDILSAFFETNTEYEVKCFTVEHNLNVDVRVKLFNLMTANGYTRKFPELSRWDDFYVRTK